MSEGLIFTFGGGGMVEHGKSSVEVIGSIIKITLSGDFNELGIRRYTSQTEKLIDELDTKAFALLIDSRNFKGATPEAYEASDSFNQRMITKNLRAKAIVHNSNLMMRIVSLHQPTMQKQRVREFQDIDSAMTWLAEQL